MVTGGLGTCCHLFTLRPRDAPLQGPSCWEGTSSMLGPEAPRDEGGSSRGLAGAALLQPQPSALCQGQPVSCP